MSRERAPDRHQASDPDRVVMDTDTRSRRARRPRRPADEVATVGAFLLGADSAFITGTDVRMGGGVTAAHFYGEVDR